MCRDMSPTAGLPDELDPPRENLLQTELTTATDARAGAPGGGRKDYLLLRGKEGEEMWTRRMKSVAMVATVALATLGVVRMSNAGTNDAQLVSEARQTTAVYKKADPGIDVFFRRSVGYVVFPGIGKGGLGIGGAHGTGVLFENGAPVGKVTMNQLTVGAQAGGQEFSQIIFYEVPGPLQELKGGKSSFSAGVSAVALSAGAAASARFKNGVAVFTATKGGLMLEASVGGQKFSYEPLPAL
jgi:lipid-binding SYLF domain-containing protein